MTDISDMTGGTELLQDASQVSSSLGIGESTIRKYCVLLQKQGYKFLTNQNGKRMYTQKEIFIFRKIIELKADMTVEQAVEQILKGQLEPSYNGHNKTEKDDELERMRLMMRNQQKMMEQIMTRLDRQEKRAAERDRLLMESLRGIQEEKKARLEASASREDGGRYVPTERSEEGNITAGRSYWGRLLNKLRGK